MANLSGKLKRSALIHYIDASFGVGTPNWFKVGVDITDLSVELNPQMDTIQNIWNETSVKDSGYQPQISVDPYYANPDDAIYSKIKQIAMKRLTGDECKTRYLEVIIDTDGDTSEAYVENCLVKPTSYGGGVDGVAIPYNIYPDGNREAGTVEFGVDKKPTFTKA